MHVLSVIGGLILLLFGRRLFWFFVAAAGFAAGMFLARDQFQLEATWLVVAIALLAGLIGALLSVLLQKVAVALAGFAAGGYLGALLTKHLNAEAFTWLGFALGGVIGAVLLLALFEWTLITLSSLVGAAFVSDGIATKDNALLIFAVFFGVGMILQTLQWRQSRKVVRTSEAAAQER